MDRYEAWMKEWVTYKFNWINSHDRVDAFVLNVIPPGNKYSTLLHYQMGQCCLAASILGQLHHSYR